MRRFLAVGAIALGLSVCARPAIAASGFKPGIPYYTLETEHFRVDYPQGMEALARRVAGYAEDAHRKVAPYLSVTSQEKTDVVCFDTYDSSNANASQEPHNRIYLNLHALMPDDFTLIGRYDDWMRFVLLHEYTHILHFNATPWALAELNAILGREIFSNLDMGGIPRDVAHQLPAELSTAPEFIVEGLAVHAESRFTPGGRAKEGDFDMLFRMAARKGTLFRADQVTSSVMLDWPSDGNYYPFGAAFFQYLTHAYGDDAPRRILAKVAEAPWLGIEVAISRVLPGKSCTSLYDEAMDWLRERSDAQSREILRRPLTVSTSLTHTGRDHWHPRWLPDGNLAYIELPKGKRSWLKLQPMGPGSQSSEWFPTGYRRDYSVSPDGRTVYGSRLYHDEVSATSDLIRYDIHARRVTRLTTGMHASEPTIAPDGNSVVAVVSSGETNHLVRFDAAGGVVRSLTEPTPSAFYANPSFSADGRSVVVARWSAGAIHVCEVDVATGVVTELTTGNALDLYPSTTPDGQYVLFTSDRGGVWNLYALRRSDRRLYRLTNVLGGAFDGRVSPDGRHLAFIEYGTEGYDVHVMPFATPSEEVDLAQAMTSDDEGHFVPRVREDPTPVDPGPGLSAEPRPYDPWRTLWPRTYTPYATGNSLGWTLGGYVHGQDVLRQHFFTVAGGAIVGGSASPLPFGTLAYQNEQFYPSLMVSLSAFPDVQAIPTVTRTGLESVYLWQSKQTLKLAARFPGMPMSLLGDRWTNGTGWTFGYHGLRSTDFAASGSDLKGLQPVTDGHPPIAWVTDQGLTHSVFVQYDRSDSRMPAYAVSPEEGSLWSLGYQKASAILGGNIAFDRVWGDYRRYVALPWEHHVLALRAASGMNWGQNGGQFTLGGTSSTSFLARTDLNAATDVFQSSVPLRGYQASSILAGNKVAVLSAEYRFPAFQVNRGLSTFPFYLDQVHGAVGYDVGSVWDQPISTDKPFHFSNLAQGLSLEARGRLVVFHVAPVDVRFGLAKGLTSPAWGPFPALHPYMQFGSTF